MNLFELSGIKVESCHEHRNEKAETLPHKSISISFVRRDVSWPPSRFWRN